MAVWLRQSTAVTVKLGPFVDSTDGNTVEGSLTISQADIRLSKNGGNIAQSNNAAGATHDELGQYDVPLDTTDTNTLGVLRVIVHETGALQVWQDFMVVPANVWDSLFGSDLLDVSVAQWLGSAPDALISGHVQADMQAALDGVLTAAKFADNFLTAAKIAAAAFASAKFAADVSTYQAKVWLFDDDGGTTDRYVVAWFKNGQPVLASITSPTIQVWKASDGSDLIASAAMTEIGTTETYKYSATAGERITDGAAYVAKVEATIDGSTRTWVQPVGRDS